MTLLSKDQKQNINIDFTSISSYWLFISILFGEFQFLSTTFNTTTTPEVISQRSHLYATPKVIFVTVFNIMLVV